jgi:L-iditol 2-dehydrogenase
MTNQMRTCYLVKQGEVSYTHSDIPALDADQVLVKVAAVGVCGSDVHYYEHGKIGPYEVKEPIILGHELSGIITAVGADVDKARIGQRVAVEPQRPCGLCALCQAGRYNLCPEMIFFATPPVDGAFCEFVAIQSKFAFEIPDSISFNAAALIEPLSVAIWALQRAKVRVGSTVLVAGAGPIGVIVAQAAKAMGASEIVVTDISDDRLAFALKHGATRTINVSNATLEDLQVDIFIDASGSVPAVYAGIKAVGPAGHAILVGMGNDDVLLPISHIQNNEIWVSGVFRYINTWPVGIEMVASGKVNLDVVVTATFGLSQVEAALKNGRLPNQLKAIVDPRVV